ncbi:MAG: thioredoxin domain-containing protein, partial [Cytophagaceae bacterium]
MTELSDAFVLSEDEIVKRLASARSQLFMARSRRLPPGLDTKVVVAWNGLMLTAIAAASKAFDQAERLDDAVQIADAVWDAAYFGPGQLMRLCHRGPGGAMGVLEDYAYYGAALLDLYE